MNTEPMNIATNVFGGDILRFSFTVKGNKIYVFGPNPFCKGNYGIPLGYHNLETSESFESPEVKDFIYQTNYYDASFDFNKWYLFLNRLFCIFFRKYSFPV